MAWIKKGGTAQRAQPLDDQPSARKIALANQKGGVGKTTTAVNLAACLALAGQRVLLVDCDPQGNASSGLGIERKKLKECIYDLFLGQRAARELVRPTRVKGLDIIPATIQLAGAEVEMAGIAQREHILKKAISDLTSDYQYILFDCPPSLGLLTVNALVASDSVIIPLQCEYYALEGLSQLVDTLLLIKRRLNPALHIEGIVFTMFDGRTNLSIQVVDEVKKHFRRQVYRTIIPRNVRLSEAPSHGKPVVLYDPKSKGAQVYQEFTEEVLQRG